MAVTIREARDFGVGVALALTLRLAHALKEGERLATRCFVRGSLQQARARVSPAPWPGTGTEAAARVEWLGEFAELCNERDVNFGVVPVEHRRPLDILVRHAGKVWSWQIGLDTPAEAVASLQGVDVCGCEQSQTLEAQAEQDAYTIGQIRSGLAAAREQVKGLQKLARELDAEIEALNTARDKLIASTDADPDATDLLDDPRMDGETWISREDVTPAMRVAWPFWEQFNTRSIVKPGEVLSDHVARPIRLAGMNERGEIAAEDMTAKHFARVSDWQCKVNADPWARFVKIHHHWLRGSRRSMLFRPAIFASVGQREPHTSD